MYQVGGNKNGKIGEKNGGKNSPKYSFPTYLYDHAKKSKEGRKVSSATNRRYEIPVHGMSLLLLRLYERRAH